MTESARLRSGRLVSRKNWVTTPKHGEPPPTGNYCATPTGNPSPTADTHLWVRIGKALPWVATQQITIHWLRHTTLTWVERNFGYAIARAYAGHTDNANAGTTATYVRANVQEIAAALAALTGEPHPLARNTYP